MSGDHRAGRRVTALSLLLGCAAALAPAFARAGGATAPDAGAPPPREELVGEKLDALLAEVARARAGTRTLRATFTQERTLTLLATSVTSTGAMSFVAPDRLRWELAPPDDVVYWVGPEGLSYRTRSSRATAPSAGANVTRALADVRALLTGDIKSLGQRYVLGASRGPTDTSIRGTARDPKAASVRAFTLVVDRSLVVPVRARLVEGKNDTIDLVFSNAQTNVPIDPATMKP